MFYQISTDPAKVKCIILLGLIAASLSCNSFSGKQQEPVARVYNSFLYREDISSIFPAGISQEDSTRIARGYIDRWIRNQLVLRHAEANLPPGEKNLDKQIAGFRASLLIHIYHQYLIGQKLDTIIHYYEIDEYYHNHVTNFILDKPAISGIFLKIPLSAPNRDRIPVWFRNAGDLVHIENYADQYAEQYMLFFDNWMYLDDILAGFPRGSVSSSGNYSGGDHIVVTDPEYQYFLGINDYLAAGIRMPVSLAGEKIKSIILNKRKIKFLNDLEMNVMREASGKNAFEYF